MTSTDYNNASTSAASSLPAARSSGLDLLFAASQLASSFNGSVVSVSDQHHSLSAATVDTSGNASRRDVMHDPSIVEFNNPKNFVQILMHILSDANNASIICWDRDGQSFLITNQELFEKTILPTYFRGSLFNSFVRRLGRWGFRRTKRNGRTSGFANDYFVRDKPWLCLQMKCQSKPSVRKLNAKEKEDVRQRAFDAGVAGASASASAHLSSPIASTSSDTLHNNSFPSSNSTTTIPSSQNNNNIAPYMGENKQRQLLIESISQTEQMERHIFFARLQQQQHIMEMQHMNRMATDEALLTAQRYQHQTTATDTGIISTTTTSPILTSQPCTPETLRRNIFSNEKNTRDT
jgi:hypothetical protein